jgi:predicted flap endonuclease-1-like 5' DNA nuclease
MATVIELERLRALTEQLVPLTTIQRGDVIRADNWNVVVGALVELARALASLETDRDVPPHEHTGDVALDWLDPQLRQLIERGPLDDPIAVTRVQQVEQRALQLGRSLDGVGTELKSMRERLDEAVTRDLVRENAMVRVNQKVEGIADTRTDVAAMRRTVATIGESVQGAVALRRDLEIDGTLFDVRSASERLASFEAMRDRLRMPNGQLLDAVTIEQRLSETENKYVTRDDLDEILKSRPGGLSADDLDTLTSNLRASFASDIDGVVKQFDDKLTTALNTRFADIDALVAKSVAGSIPAVRDSIAESLRAELLGVVKENTDKISVDFDSKLDGLRKEIGATLDKGIGALQDSVTKEMAGIRATIVSRDDIGAMLNDRVAPLEENIAKVSADRAATDKRLSADLADLGTRLSALDTTMQTSLKALDDRLTTQINTTRLDLEKLIDSRLAASLKDLTASTTTLINSSIAESEKRTADATAKLVDARVAEGLKSFDATINTRMADVEKKLRAAVTDEVKLQLANQGRTATGTTTGTTTQPATAGDDFTRIAGVGAALATRLRSSGITTFKQLAAMKPADVASILNKSEADAAAIIKEAKRLAG